MNKTTIIYLVLFVAGVVLADKVRQLPLANKLPTL